MLEVFLEALKESLISLPFLLVIYFIMELLEHKKEVQFEKFVAKSKKTGPLWGSLIGCIPQCAFSAVMADLFSKKMITLGTLLAVFIATSDEAVVVLISTPNKILNVLLLVAIKVVIAIIIGFIVDLIFKNQVIKEDNIHHNTHYHHEHTHKHNEKCNSENVIANEKYNDAYSDAKDFNNSQVDKQVELSSQKVQVNCPCCDENEICEECSQEEISCEECEHNKLHHKHELETCLHNEKKEILSIFLESLKHTGIIFAWILGANLVLGTLIEFVGLENLQQVMLSGTIFEPIILTLFGLIPNCGASVAIVNLYLSGIVSFGSCVGALCTGAGIGTIILFKNNKNIKQNLSILLFLYAIGVIVGFVINLIPLGL